MSVVAQIISDAINSSPLAVRSDTVTAHYASYKYNRILSCYSKVVRTFERLVADQGEIRTIAEHPKLFQAYNISKSRLSRLDYKKIIGRTYIDEWHKQVKDADALFVWTGYDFSKPSQEPTDPIFRQAANRAYNFVAQSAIFRIQDHLDYHGGYPVFWTFTCDPQNEIVLKSGREEFKLFCRKLKRQFGNFTFCAVPELGEETKRLHLHALFIFEDASKFTDPNFGHARGNLQLIPELRGLWEYGFSDPIAARTSPLDVWGELGWQWPAGQETSNHEAIAVYMAGYMNKDRKDIKGCRTRMSKGFGLARLEQMTLSEAILILSGNPNPFLTRVKMAAKCPPRFLKQIAAKKVFRPAFHPVLPLPKSGSVRDASSILKAQKSNLLNAGHSVSRGEHSEVELDQYHSLEKGVPIGLM